MEFSARDDIEAPIEYVFDQVTDFAAFERSIMRRGGDVERIVGGDAPEVGAKWTVKFQMRGKERSVEAEIVQVDAPNGLSFEVRSPNVNGAMQIELVALSRARTRIIVIAKADAKTIPAKVLFQSLRFARSKTDLRFKTLVTDFARDIEARQKA